MLKLLTLLVYLFFNTSLFPYFEGVYELSVLDSASKVISRATGFAIKLKGQYIVTSYHLLDNNILKADKITLNFYGRDLDLKIAGFDELRDILVLKANDEEFEQSKFLSLSECRNQSGLSVIGFKDSEQFLVPSETTDRTEVEDFFTLDTFLPKGFSGSPVLEESNLNVCGMVLLSDKEDVSSVYVNSLRIKTTIAQSKSAYTVTEYRVSNGLEYIIRTNKELEKISRRVGRRQVIVNILGNDFYVVNNAKNLVLNFLNQNIKGVKVLASENIYINGVHGGSVVLKDSHSVSIVNSIFKNDEYGIFLVNSSDLLISNNNFLSLSNGILIKGISKEGLDSIFVYRNKYKGVGTKFAVVG